MASRELYILEGVASRCIFLPDPFAAKAVTRDTCLMSGVTAGETARIGGVVGTSSIPC
jgi:hypothetical protein